MNSCLGPKEKKSCKYVIQKSCFAEISVKGWGTCNVLGNNYTNRTAKVRRHPALVSRSTALETPRFLMMVPCKSAWRRAVLGGMALLMKHVRHSLGLPEIFEGSSSWSLDLCEQMR